MAGDGPTTAGSITGKLKLDTSDWDAKIAAADAAARKLGSVDPTIRVEVEIAGALEKLALVDAASKKLNDSQSNLTNSTNSLNAANGAGVQRWQMIAGLIVALIPLFVPLMGAAVGLAGAFTMLGAAGVLGVLGVVSAMKQGTAVGLEYSDGLKQLKSDLDQLSSTAAASLLQAFHTSISDINAAMPLLNGQIGWFSSQLGVIGTSALQAVINGLRVLNPLFVQASNYVKSLVVGFESWTANGGLQKFASYAEATFPTVTAALGALVAAAFNLASALAPIGIVMLNVVTAAASLLQWISSLGPVLGIVAGGAAAAFGAFKLWGVIGPIIASVAEVVYTATDSVVALGVAIDATSGPVGWVVAGIGALVAVLGISAAATQQNTQATDSYTSALQASNGALDENVRKQVAKNLSDAGLLSTARQYHLQLSTVTDAVLGNKDAMAQVTEATNKYGQQLVEVHGESGAVTNTYSAMSDKGREFLAMVKGQTGSLEASVQAFKDQQAAASGTLPSVQNLTDALNAQQSAATLLNNEFKLLNGQNLSVAEAQTAQAAAFNTVTDSIQKNGTAIDGNSASAVANQQAIQQAAQAAQQNAAAIVTQTGSTDAGTQAFISSKQALENQLAAQGNLTPAVQSYIDTLFQVPAELTTQLNVDNAAALAAINATQSALRALGQSESKYGISPQNMATTGGTKVAFAAGGTVSGPGSSTSDSVDAKLSASEEVVSNGSGQADRWRSVLKLINANASGTSILGKVLSMAGSMAPQSFTVAPQTSKSVVNNTYVTNQFTVLANDPNELTQKVSMRQNRLGVV